METVETKIDKLAEEMRNSFKEVNKRFDDMEVLMGKGFNDVHARVDLLEDEVKDFRKNFQNNKLDTGDKYATTIRVDGHESRIQKLEAKAV